MSDLSPPQHASPPPPNENLTPDSTDNTPTHRPEGGAEAPVEGSGEGHAEAGEQGRGEEKGASQESSDDSPKIKQQPSETTEPAPRQASPATSVAASGTSTPPLGPLPKKKFAAVNVNQKFLQKTASPVPAPGAVKTNGRQTASPVPILPAPSRHLSTKLNTMTAKPPPAPAPPPITNSSPWAKPANVAEGGTLHQPAPTKLRVGGVLPPAATGASAANTSNAWRTSAAPPKHLGLSRDFPTAKEVADSKRAAAAVEEATAAATEAHNKAILQELNSFTQLDPHAHRWDEDSDEDEFNLPPAPPPPQPQTIQRDDIPVSKSDRFASDDFDRSWPRRPTGERILFDAGTSRGAPVPPAAPAQSAQGGKGWNSRLMGRGDNWRERSASSNGPAPSAPGISRNLPPHLTDAPTDREKDAQKPAAPEPAAVPPRQLGRWGSGMQAESGSTGRTGWGSRVTEERALPPHVPAPIPSAAPVPPRRSFIGVRPSPPTSNSSLPHVQPPPSTLPPVEDEQHQEMHTAAEKARLRRLEEEKEREAAKERARKKAKELEERMMAKAPAPAAAKEAKEDKDEAKSVRPTSIAQRPKDLGLPQRPSRSPAGFASETGKDKERESRAETESSWRVRAPSSQATRAEENKDEIVTPVAIPASSEVPHPAELALDGELDRTPHAKSSSSFDGMLDRIKAAMSKMQEEKDQPKDAGVAPASPVKKEEAKEERKVILEREKKPPTEPRADRLSAAPLPPAQPQMQAKPIPTAPKAKPQPPTISVPTFFDISYPAPPRSPPPAWRTMTIRVPKFDLPHRTPVPKAQMDSFFAPLNYPKGWARSFNPPLELHQRALFGPGNRPPPRENEGVVDRSRLLLPAGRVKTKEGEVVVSISPRVLTRSRPRKMGVDGEVGGKSSVTAPPAAGQESGDAVPRKRSPSARSAAQAEKSGSGYILQGVGLTISPPPGVSLPSSLSLGTALDQSETEEGGADDRKGREGVRFLVSSELEGDSLLEEVNKMSLESVEEEEGKDGEEPPKTSGIAQSPESNGPSTPWAQSSLSYGHSSKPSITQHDAIKSVWESDSKPTPAPISSTAANPPATSSSALSETPMYPSINTPSNSDVGAGTQPLSSSFVAAPGPSATGFSPQLGSAPFTRHPSNQSQSAQTASLHSHNPSQGQSPYFGSPHAHSLTSPDPTGGAYAGMGMSTMGGMGMGMGVPLGYTSRPMGSSAVGNGGWQQNVWGGFNAMNGYGYTQAPQQTHHQTQPGQGKDKAYQSYAGQQAQQPAQGYGVPGYPRMNPAPAQAPGYTFTPGYSSHSTHATSPQVRPQGRFAQANGDYARQAQQQQQQAVGQGGNGFRMSATSGDGGYYGGVSGYAPQGQTGSSQSQPQGSGQSGAQGSFGRSTRGGLQRRVW